MSEAVVWAAEVDGRRAEGRSAGASKRRRGEGALDGTTRCETERYCGR
jgi:hypothetical protein